VKKIYKDYELKCKRIYKRQEGDMLNRLQKDNPRKFDSLFRRKKQQNTCNLSITDCFDFHCTRKFCLEPSSVKIFFSHEKESNNLFSYHVEKKYIFPSVVGFMLLKFSSAIFFLSSR
jgi:hypothetical protein